MTFISRYITVCVKMHTFHHFHLSIWRKLTNFRWKIASIFGFLGLFERQKGAFVWKIQNTRYDALFARYSCYKYSVGSHWTRVSLPFSFTKCISIDWGYWFCFRLCLNKKVHYVHVDTYTEYEYDSYGKYFLQKKTQLSK